MGQSLSENSFTHYQSRREQLLEFGKSRTQNCSPFADQAGLKDNP